MTGERVQRHGCADNGGYLVEQPALEGRLKSPRIAVGESRELVGRVQLAADVPGQQGDVERVDQSLLQNGSNEDDIQDHVV